MKQICSKPKGFNTFALVFLKCLLDDIWNLRSLESDPGYGVEQLMKEMEDQLKTLIFIANDE